jgi:hypothetical protein
VTQRNESVSLKASKGQSLFCFWCRCCLFVVDSLPSGCVLYSSQFCTIFYTVTSDSSGAELTIDWNAEIKDEKTKSVLIEFGSGQHVTKVLPCSSVKLHEEHRDSRQVMYLIEPLQQSLVLPVTLTVELSAADYSSGVKQLSTCNLSILCRAYPDTASSDEIERAFLASPEIVIAEKFVFPSDLGFRKVTKLLRKALNSAIVAIDNDEKTASFALIFWNGIRLYVSMKKAKRKVTLNFKGVGENEGKSRKVIVDTIETLRLWNFTS